MTRRQVLFHELLQLSGPADGVPWQLQVWDDAAGRYVVLTGGGGSVPVVSPLQQPLPAQPLTVRGDPPDFITTGGDLIIMAGHQPGFIMDPSGDLVTAEGL